MSAEDRKKTTGVSKTPHLPGFLEPGAITKSATAEAWRRGLAARDTGTAPDPLGRKQNGGPSTKKNG